jgi:hypothetical protein
LYTQLATDTQGAVAKTSSVEIAMRIKSTVHDLGRTCIDLVKAGGARQGAPDDVFTQRDLSDAARLVGEKVKKTSYYQIRLNLIKIYGSILGIASFGCFASQFPRNSGVH